MWMGPASPPKLTLGGGALAGSPVEAALGCGPVGGDPCQRCRMAWPVPAPPRPGARVTGTVHAPSCRRLCRLRLAAGPLRRPLVRPLARIRNLVLASQVGEQASGEGQLLAARAGEQPCSRCPRCCWQGYRALAVARCSGEVSPVAVRPDICARRLSILMLTPQGRLNMRH
jgi:hypothetical protein